MSMTVFVSVSELKHTYSFDFVLFSTKTTEKIPEC